jgi:hypothetical protein
MESTFDAGSIITSEISDAACNILDIFARDQSIGEVRGVARETCFRLTAEVQNDFY